MTTFDAFLPAFFSVFTQPQFRGNDFAAYLQKPAPRRTGDEASIVDNAIVGPLLGLLGYAHGEQVYNQGKKFGRPDFAPETDDYGVCFVVESKSTGLALNLDTTDPESHLSQLIGYLHGFGIRSGWLTNGRRITVWELNNSGQPHCLCSLELGEALSAWAQGGREALPADSLQSLRVLWEQFRREAFSDWERIESQLALDAEEWLEQALPLGGNPANQELLVGAVRTLLQDLQSDAASRLKGHLDRYDIYERSSSLLRDDDTEPAAEKMTKLRSNVIAEMDRVAALVGMEEAEIAHFRNRLYALERDPFVVLNTKELLQTTLEAINAARQRKFAGEKRASSGWARWDNGLGALGDALGAYGDMAFEWHRRKSFFRHDYRESIEVRENYAIWTAIVQETMLGGLDEDQRRAEFALQAAYVVLIRMMLIRVCEDKGILRNRFLSNSGLKVWQECIERYYLFATGNPYEHLLDMAFENAQNIYAHFFTGRELFNWYTLSRVRFIRVLRQLSRFNFAGVDSDLIGTIYNTYVERPEKKQKGQYYTPPEIVRYILDETGYLPGPEIIGPNKRLIDPACGSGTFLVEGARRLVAAYSAVSHPNPRQLIDQVRNNLYGFDLNPFACYLAEVNLLIQVLDLVKLALDGKTPPNLQRFHVYNADALAPSSGVVQFARSNTLMAEEIDVVDRIKGRQEEYAAGFGWVVANPPYGAGLTETYKRSLREWWPSVFYGVPDTYVFFFALALKLLGANGRLGFITPNTYLMGTNTPNLREHLLTAGRITQIVDLPAGIWKDVNVDCALLFLCVEADAEKRKAQQTQVFSMAVRDTLEKLTAREWQETFNQSQSAWMEDAGHDINIRWTPLLTQIEEVCRVVINGGPSTKIYRIGDVIKTSRGVEPYHSREQGKSGIFIKTQRELSQEEKHWKPLLDSSSYIGRYELRWGKGRPHLNYGKWLYRSYDPVYYESPKLLVQDMRNRALQRRLVATYDAKGFYNRHNFSNIIAQDAAYDLKYILALFNSSLLNYWFARQYDNVHINPSYFRTLPIYPAAAEIQAELVAIVDELLDKNAALNVLREQDMVIRTRRNGTREVMVPYDVLLKQMQEKDRRFPVYSLFDARAAGLLRLPEQCDPEAQISRVFTPDKFPGTVVLRSGQLWLEVDDADIRRYLLNYLARPQWKTRSWEEICTEALLPEPPGALAALFAEEQRIVGEINTTLDAIAAADLKLDNRVLDLYGITDPADRRRILDSAPAAEDADAETDLPPEPEPDTD